MFSPDLPEPVCREERPPHTGPERRTGSPGCGGFGDERGSRTRPAALLPLHCCEEAGLEGQDTVKQCIIQGKNLKTTY